MESGRFRNNHRRYLWAMLPAFWQGACVPSDARSQPPPPTPPAIRYAIAQQCNLVIDPELLSLGNSTSGHVITVKLKIRNLHFDPITIDRVKTSCPCLMVKSLPVRLSACESVSIEVVFDPNIEPDFRGSLDIELDGLDPAGNLLFQSRAKVVVLDHTPVDTTWIVDPQSQSGSENSESTVGFPAGKSGIDHLHTSRNFL